MKLADPRSHHLIAVAQFECPIAFDRQVEWRAGRLQLALRVTSEILAVVKRLTGGNGIAIGIELAVAAANPVAERKVALIVIGIGAETDRRQQSRTTLR